MSSLWKGLSGGKDMIEYVRVVKRIVGFDSAVEKHFRWLNTTKSPRKVQNTTVLFDMLPR